MSIAHIQKDNTSGADEILQRAGQALHNLIQIENFSSVTEAQEFIKGIGRELILSQPRMAVIANLVNRMYFACDQAGDAKSCQSNVLHKINNFLQLSITAKFLLMQRLDSLLGNYAVIATFSRSSQVIFILSELSKKHNFSVCLTEARPMLEGRHAAQELTDAGVSVTLMIDAALKQIVEMCDIVLVGADSFNGSLVINKIGTGMLAMLAQAAAKPVYAVCTLQKYLPLRIVQPAEPAHSGNEVWEDRPEKVQIINSYFEEIPVNLFTGVITENGILNAQGLDELEGNNPLHPWLVEILGKV